MEKETQIFQTPTRTRWQRFKWSFRTLLFLAVLALVFIAIGFKTLYQPAIPLKGHAMKKVLAGDVPAYRESKLGKQYRGMRRFIEDKWARAPRNRGERYKQNALSLFNDSTGIRAAFYVSWGAQSLSSLKSNIDKINLVFPEWFFIDPAADTLYATVDADALRVIRAAKIKTIPILSNNYREVFRGDALHRILTNPQKKERLIRDIITQVQRFGFNGINIDFEELQENSNEPLVLFQKELYTRMHAAGLMVTQDVMAFNEDYDYTQLAQYNDYLVLMAYDQFSEDSKPGPVSSQHWIEAAVDRIAAKVPSEKIILGMAAYGYDWKISGGPALPVTYQQALALARESEGVVDFDDDTYNLHYEYYDDTNSVHQVYFTDAATNFNTLRFATEYGLAGTALWRLGSEDSRLWDFYALPMTKASLRHFNFNEFNKIESRTDPDYKGEGEVLDIVATPTDGHITPEIDTAQMLISEERYDKLPSTYVIQKWGGTNQKKLVLTFDDGPDPKYTPEILDTLSKYHVPATFFLVGYEAENNIPLVQRIFREGHEIGNHTFTHPNMAEVGPRRAMLEMDATRLLIECITGHSTIMFRAPFNADSEPGKNEELVPVAISRKRNYITVGESIDPNDWEYGEIPHFNADSIYNRVVAAYERRIALDSSDINGSIILLHDAGGDRSQTVLATGRIIRFFQQRGYKFTTVADLLGKKREDVMPPVPKGSGYYLLQFNYLLAELGYILGGLFTTLFIVFLVAGAVRLLTIGVLAWLQRRKEKALPAAVAMAAADQPLVSIIVPAYNEEVNAVSSLQNLLLCDYAHMEIVFVDDGSKDQTYQRVLEAFREDNRMRIYTKPNGGKASALNYGIAQAHGDYVVCIDADTKLRPDAVRLLMAHFRDKQVGAVAGTVKVGNEVNLITRWQSIEYTTSQNFDRKAFAYVNAITVVPGAIGAFRKDALVLAGGFTTDTLAEDCDLTVRILKAGYVITNEPAAYAFTEAPETIRQFLKQRFRWSFGVMQTFWKNKGLLFTRRNKGLGWLALPDILLFKYIIPFFSPLADLMMLLGLLTNNAGKIGGYYLAFMVVDALIAYIAFLYEKEKVWKLVWLIPQRLIYRWLMLVVLFRSIRFAIKGELQQWGVLKRTGNVKEVSMV